MFQYGNIFQSASQIGGFVHYYRMCSNAVGCKHTIMLLIWISFSINTLEAYLEIKKLKASSQRGAILTATQMRLMAISWKTFIHRSAIFPILMLANKWMCGDMQRCVSTALLIFCSQTEMHPVAVIFMPKLMEYNLVP